MNELLHSTMRIAKHCYFGHYLTRVGARTTMTTLSPVSPKPAHVPDAAVYDFDMFLDPALLIDPHERVRQVLREAPPVFWTPRNGGHWVAAGHAEVFAASRDTENFSSEIMPRSQMAMMMSMLPAGMPRMPLPTPINLDPPDHTRYRAPLQLALSLIHI